MIFALNAFSVSEFFISFGKMSLGIFGAKKETDSVLYLAQFTLRLYKELFPHLKGVGKALAEF